MTSAPKSDNGAALALSIAEDDMDAIEAHFSDRCDLDNAEMALLVTVRNLRTQVRLLARAAGAAGAK